MLFNSMGAACPEELWMFCGSHQEETPGRLSCLFLMRKAKNNREASAVSAP